MKLKRPHAAFIVGFNVSGLWLYGTSHLSTYVRLFCIGRHNVVALGNLILCNHGNVLYRIVKPFWLESVVCWIFVYYLWILKLYMGSYSVLPLVLHIHHGTCFIGKASWIRCDKY